MVEDTQKIVWSYLDLLDNINNVVPFLSPNKLGYANFINKENGLLLVIDLKRLQQNNHSISDYDKLDIPKFINVASLLDMKIRHENRNSTLQEYLTRQIAFEMINIRGYSEAPIVPWGNSGFRKIQTQASITDPGLGHLTGTIRKMEYINGTNVHIEYLERGKENNRELVEPYRLPDLATIGKVKMSVGRDTSVSSYVGRPMFEDRFDNSFIKSVHTTIAVCSAIFMNGLSECKVAIEKMTVTQAIKFMRAVSANVVRDENLQVLAAAFCINYPLIDDRNETLRKNNGKPRRITDRMEIAKLGIEITKAGNFDKVTFDGTANWYPSDPIMEQLGYKRALELVHKSHEVGLLTYFSAGFRFKHLMEIVQTGTDGIGLGGAQILRFMDSKNGYHGPFKEENIKKILTINQSAARSIIGRGAILLSRLDRMYFEKSLPEWVEEQRKKLYKALLIRDEESVSYILKVLQEIVELPCDYVHPLVAWAQRIISNKNDAIVFSNMNKKEKEYYISRLKRYVNCHDYTALNTVLKELISK
ncbi:hypothetical protein FP435_05350 [Lactobacillus sp. PV037]|uniref:hypothetical protein n=1 Tax=unclassified Lactobacillus TaxID=2620435 RepID=UPI00223EF069|nr:MULTISPECIES: hypothetical protein [unclassified Lactobacillus]QNQ82051.1 hypothetical protein FP433_02895 [Lactobacillus sp. PV012]QNQ83914.1 hypothetical protein FP435_05350 [Lactobacillus sp. PV037]